RRHALTVRETPADQHVETDGAVCPFGRPQPDVVDLDPSAVLRAARDGDLELARQIGVLTVARKERGNGLSHGQCGDDFLLVDARDGARADVACGVATRLDRGQADIPET